ncbi:MAG: CHAT domain-containing protein, partial [bacterium]|nr:CHAT domain-containing protein [bacterium]
MSISRNRRSRTPGPTPSLLLGLAVALLGCGDGTAPRAVEEAESSAGVDHQNVEEISMQIPDPGNTASLGADEVHFRELELGEDEFVHLVVRQQGLDVKLRLRDPDPGGEIMIEVDSPSGPRGPEELVAIVPENGRYRLEVVAPAEAEPGQYAVEALEQRPPTADDRDWVEADEIYRGARASLKAKSYPEARDALRSILPTWQRLGLRHRQAATHEQLGTALYNTNERPAALWEYEQAVDWFRALGEQRQLANSIEKAATLHLLLGQTPRALELLGEARPIFEEQDHRRGLSLCLSRLGFAHLIQGHPQEALGYLEEGLVIAEELGRSGLQASLLTDMGKALLTLQRSQEALERYSRAVELYQQSEEAEGLEAALAGVANAAAQLGNLTAAEKAVNEAIAALWTADEPRMRAALLTTRGHIHRLRGEPEEAGKALEQALAFATKTDDPRLEADVLLSLGYLGAQGVAPERGIELCDRAFALYERAGQLSGMASSRARAAQALLALDRFDEAWQRLEPALGEVERFRAATARRDHRLSFFSSFRQDYFEIARDVLLRLGDAKSEAQYDWRAFVVDEQRRSRELLDSLTFRGAEPAAAEPEILAEERRLEQTLRDAASRDPSPETSRSTEQQIAELYRLRAEIRRTPPPPPQRPPMIDRDLLLNQLLDGETLLLVYSLGEERSVLWAVTPDGLRHHPLPERSDLERRARRFAELVVRRAPHVQARRAEQGRELSRLLLEPVADLLGDRRLVIVADGELRRVPFAALPEPGDHDDQAFLVRRHEIVYLPSVSALAALRQRSGRSPEEIRIAVFADPVFDADDPRVRRPGPGSGAPSHPRLPDSRREAQKIVEMAGGEGHLLALD